MNVLLFMSVFWILYGIAGLLGFQNIPAKYKYNLLKPKVLKVKIEIAGEFNDEN